MLQLFRFVFVKAGFSDGCKLHVDLNLSSSSSFLTVPVCM